MTILFLVISDLGPSEALTYIGQISLVPLKILAQFLHFEN